MHPLPISFSLALLALSSAAQDPTPHSPRGPAFVQNAGQWPESVAFRAQAGNVTAWIQRDRIAISLSSGAMSRSVPRDVPGDADSARAQSTSLALRFSGHATRIEGLGQRTGVRHFLVGPRASWRTNVATFDAVRLSDVWPGIDIVIRGSDAAATNGIAYDVEADPGADLRQVQFEVVGAQSLKLNGVGEMIAHTSAGQLLQSAPVSWQRGPDDDSLPRRSRFELVDATTFRIAADGVDPNLPLTIDPDLRWRSNLAGSALDFSEAVAIASNGDTFTAGHTDSPNFPGSTRVAVGRDAFVSRLDSTGTLLWTTVFGGSSDDVCFDLDLTFDDRPVLVGVTDSSDLPVTPNAPQSAYAGAPNDAWLAILTADGSGFACLSYWGGETADWATAVHVDWARNLMTVGGYTGSDDFTTTPNAYQAAPPILKDAFVSQFDVTSLGVAYSTVLGGSGQEGASGNPWISNIGTLLQLDVDVDAAGRVLVAGRTSSNDFPTTPNAYQTTRRSGDAFVTILDPSRAPALQNVASTLLGGDRGEGAAACGFGPKGEVVVSGYTYSVDPNRLPYFPTTAGAFERTPVGPVNSNDGFVSWLTPDLSGLTYSTFLNGDGNEVVRALIVDSRCHATVAGFTNGSFPTTPGAHDTTTVANQRGFIARLRPEGGGSLDMTYGTFMGSSNIRDLVPLPRGGVAFAGRANNVTNDATVGQLELLPGWYATTGVKRGTCSTPGCLGEVLIEVDRLPQPNTPVEVLIGNAPRSAAGALLIAGGPWTGSCLSILQTDLAIPAPLFGISIASDDCGSFTLPFPNLPATYAPIALHMQAIWIETGGCGKPLASSPSIEF